MYKIINPVEQHIKDKIEMYKNDMFNLNHCIERNRKENKRFRTELSETKAKVLALQIQLAKQS
jgi:predicted RNase H-like nuclease (RuvC/YqgF family)